MSEAVITVTALPTDLLQNYKHGTKMNIRLI